MKQFVYVGVLVTVVGYDLRLVVFVFTQCSDFAFDFVLFACLLFEFGAVVKDLFFLSFTSFELVFVSSLGSLAFVFVVLKELIGLIGYKVPCRRILALLGYASRGL